MQYRVRAALRDTVDTLVIPGGRLQKAPTASDTTPYLEIFRLPEMTRLGRIRFDGAPYVTPKRL